MPQASTQDENWCGVIQVSIPRAVHPEAFPRIITSPQTNTPLLAPQEVCLDCGGDPARFMLAAQDFANDRCWGTLSCAVFVHPATQVGAAECMHALCSKALAGWPSL